LRLTKPLVCRNLELLIHSRRFIQSLSAANPIFLYRTDTFDGACLLDIDICGISADKNDLNCLL
jgi:hypothetical protein